jgi:hypothetical protein
MPDIIYNKDQNILGISALSANDNNLTTAINSITNESGLGFQGFSIKSLGPTSDYKTQADEYKKDLNNFKFFDMIPIGTGLPGMKLSEASANPRELPDNSPLRTWYDYDLNNGPLFYYNLRWYLHIHPNGLNTIIPNSNQNHGDFIKTKPFFSSFNATRRPPSLRINFSNSLQQDFLMYYGVTSHIKLKISCGNNNATIELPAFIRPNGSLCNSILFVHKPKELTNRDKVTIRAKAVLKDQRLNVPNNPLPQFEPFIRRYIDDNSRTVNGWFFNSSTPTDETKINSNLTRILAASTNANYYDEWDIVYSPKIDYIYSERHDPGVIEIENSYDEDNENLIITTKSPIPDYWTTIIINNHRISRANAVWKMTPTDEENTYRLTTKKIISNGADGGTINRYLNGSTLRPKLSSFNNFLKKELDAILKSCIEERIYSLNKDNNKNLKNEIEIRIKNMFNDSSAKTDLQLALDILNNSTCSIKIEFIDIINKTNLDNNFSLPSDSVSDNFINGLFLGDVNNIILKHKYNINTNIFIVNMNLTGKEFNIETYKKAIREK